MFWVQISLSFSLVVLIKDAFNSKGPYLQAALDLV